MVDCVCWFGLIPYAANCFVVMLIAVLFVIFKSNCCTLHFVFNLLLELSWFIIGFLLYCWNCCWYIGCLLVLTFGDLFGYLCLLWVCLLVVCLLVLLAACVCFVCFVLVICWVWIN